MSNIFIVVVPYRERNSGDALNNAGTLVVGNLVNVERCVFGFMVVKIMVVVVVVVDQGTVGFIFTM